MPLQRRTLVADIGGTKTDLALFEAGQKQPFKRQIYKNSHYDSFEQLLQQFLDNRPVQRACFAIAGPVCADSCEMTNLGWFFDRKTLKKQFAFEQLLFINDMEAMAWGVSDLTAESYTELNPAGQFKDENRIVLGVGTGLGQAILVNQTGIKTVISGEGGHTDFAPLNPTQDALLQWLRKHYPEHVSYERILCGNGFSLLYQFYQQYTPSDINASFDQQLNNAEDANALISTAALNQSDNIATRVMQLFISILAAQAANVCLGLLPKGGLYLTGGVIQKNLAALQTPQFMASFLAKGRMQKVLQTLPLRAVTSEELAIKGGLIALDKKSS